MDRLEVLILAGRLLVERIDIPSTEELPGVLRKSIRDDSSCLSDIVNFCICAFESSADSFALAFSRTNLYDHLLRRDGDAFHLLKTRLGYSSMAKLTSKCH
jgi:hypothetical protein